MAKQKYIDKLKHPKWQKKRLEILNRDNFTCQKCHSTENTLHIHHNYYDGSEPWDYDNDALITLCFECHEAEEFLKSFVTSGVEYLHSIGFLRTDLRDIVSVVSHRLDLLEGIKRRVYIQDIVKLITDHE